MKVCIPGQFLLGTRTISLMEKFLQLYTVNGKGLSSDALISSMNVVSSDLNGIPLAAVMKSKNDTKPPFAAGL